MTAYLASFDLRTLGTLTLSTSGKSSISIAFPSYTPGTGYALASTTRYMNHSIGGSAAGFDLYGSQLRCGKLASSTFIASVQTSLRALAATASWTSPSSIGVTLNAISWHVTFSYPTAFTAITFSDTATRRVFGFSGNFSGSSASVTGTEVPKYIILPTIDGTSSPSPVFEDDAVSSLAYAGSGRTFGLSRSTVAQRRTWAQQYQSKASVFRKFAAAAPDEFTFQDLFESCRTGLPFGVFEGFGEVEYQVYMFSDGQEAFRAIPATPGNADQFHIAFDCIAVGRM